jgi:hypothetical protein
MVRLKKQAEKKQVEAEEKVLVVKKEEKVEKTIDNGLNKEYDRERKRKSISRGRGKLEVSADAQDPRFTYRWAKNNSSRINQLTNEDWFIVDNSELAKEKTGKSGSQVVVHGGIDNRNNEYGLILMAKKKEWHEADQKEKGKLVRQTEDIINEQKTKVEGNYKTK